MPGTGSRRGAVNLNVIIMILAFVSMAGLMYWLSQTAVGTQVETVEAAPEDTMPAEPEVAFDSIRTTPDDYTVGEFQTRVRVASRLGDQLFWGGPDDNPFLVKMDSVTVADTTLQLASDDTVTVVGSVRAMSDSILSDWVETGVITEAQEIEASFATHFLTSREIRRPDDDQEEDGEDGQGGQDGGGTGGSDD